MEADFPENKLVFNLKTRMALILNPQAKKIWSYLKKPRTQKQIVNYLYQSYKVDKIRLEKDIYSLVEKLLNTGLVAYVKKS